MLKTKTHAVVESVAGKEEDREWKTHKKNIGKKKIGTESKKKKKKVVGEQRGRNSRRQLIGKNFGSAFTRLTG